MVATFRAALCVCMLAGFYVLALGIIGGLAWLSVLFWQQDHEAGAAKIGYVTIVVAIAVAGALWKVLRAKAEAATGVQLTPERAPELWQMVRELARQEKTRAPEEILVIPDVNAAVSEDTRLLGLVGGRRRLYLGAPVVQALTVSQLQAVLAHEMGHYSRRHTRLGAIAHRGRMAIVATADRLSGSVIGYLFTGYAKLYVLVAAAVSRRQELEADQAMVRVAGRSVAQSTLRKLPVIDAAWRFYVGRYVRPAWEAGYMPKDFFGGFASLLAARQDEIAKLRDKEPPQEKSTWDTHPPIAERIAAMESMPDSAVSADTRPAHALIPGYDEVRLELARLTVKADGRTPVDWDELTTVGLVTEEQREADHIYRAAARFAGTGGANLSTVLGFVESGRIGEFAASLFPNATKEEAATLFANPLHLLLRVAAIRSGAGRWQHSWSTAPTFVNAEGAPFDDDLAKVAAQAVDATTLDAAKARMAELGIDISRATQVDKVATAHGGQVIGGLANVKMNGSPHDLLILTNGLVLAPCPKKTDGGKDRLIGMLESAPLTELAQRNTFIPYEEIASATIVKESPIRVELTLHDGQMLAIYESWTGDRLTKESADTLKEALSPFVAGAAGEDE